MMIRYRATGFDPDGRRNRGPITSEIPQSAGRISTCATSVTCWAHMHDQAIEIGEGPEPPRQRPLHYAVRTGIIL
jgi:hypothetical protein